MKENFNPSWNHWSHCTTNCVGDHSSVKRVNEFMRNYGSQVSHLLICLSSLTFAL